MLGIGAIIGAGIFATIGTAAAGDAQRPGAGPALVLSFVVTAVVCGFTALCYAELASLVPISGSAYTYTYATLGELLAWIIGWDLIIEYAVGNIAVAISWANYCKTFLAGFGFNVPDWLSMDYRTAARIVDADGVLAVYRDAPSFLGVPIVFNLLAVLIVAAITLILVWGIRESARFNAGMVGVKLVVLAFFVAVGLYWVEPANWHPFAPNGWAGISAGAAIVFFAYIGFDAVSTVAEETRDPQRSLPIGILASLAVCTIVYIVVAAVFTGLIGYDELRSRLSTEQAEPLTLALSQAGPGLGWAVGIVAFGSIVAHTAVLLVFQLGQPRIFFSMSRDGLLPAIFRRVHPRFRTPHISTVLTGLFVGGFAAVASLDEMVDLTNIGTLFAFLLVCAGTIVLRIQDPSRHRPFRVPGGWTWAGALYAALALAMLALPMSGGTKAALLIAGAVFFGLARNHIVPALGILSCLYLIYYLPPTSWLRFAAWLNLGFVLYGSYGSVHSRLTGRDTAADPVEHDASSAELGAWLGVAGVFLLFLARGLDLFRGGWSTSSTLPPSGRIAAALGSIVRGGDWLSPSAFLWAPLAVTMLVLCPVVLVRATRVIGRSRGPSRRSSARAVALAVGLMVVSGIYLAVAGFR